MSNKTGYIIGFLCTIVYTIIQYGINFNRLLDFFAYLLGTLLFPAIIAGLITLFSKKKNFGKVFGITCIIVCIVAGMGNFLYESR